MMRVRRDSANHNRPAGKLGKEAAPDLDGGRAVADAAFVCLRIIADSQCDLPQLGKFGLFERDSGCSGLGCARLPA